ncbi:MAG: hypothetical protein IPJ94_29695 [Chloroflexi bacterium]|nr:hypothetical protein [Chloroflexota bacterium]
MKDEYIMFSLRRTRGTGLCHCLPSMRLLKSIAVFTPEPWQGYGYGASRTMDCLKKARWRSRRYLGRHPSPGAEWNASGDCDGQYLFSINDEANARIAVIDLRDFGNETDCQNPIALNDHGGTMVTPDGFGSSEGGQYACAVGATI